MRNLITLALGLLLWMASAEAQILRIGERVPTINVDSSAGSDLKLVDKEYTCLIFMHSKSNPSIEAIRQFTAFTTPLRQRLGIVLLTPEQDGFEEEMLRNITTNDTIIAFDNEGQTFSNFRVSYVPFAVIYSTRTRRVAWFGSLSQLDESNIHTIIE